MTRKCFILPAIISACLIIAGGLLLIGTYFESHFYPGSTVNGVSVSMLSADLAYERLIKSNENYQLQIVDAVGNTDSIVRSDVGLDVLITAAQLRDFIKSQQGYMWLRYYLQPKEYEATEFVSLDETLLSNVVDSLSCHDSDIVKDVNAAYFYDNDKYYVVEEEYGDIDTEALYDIIKSAILVRMPMVNLVDEGAYRLPRTMVDTSELYKRVDLLNEHKPGSITYDLGQGITEVISADSLMDWMEFNDDGTICVNRTKVEEFVDLMKSKYDTLDKDKKLLASSDNTIVTVKAGTYGWCIDKDAEIDQLITDIQSCTNVTRDFIYSSVAASHLDNDFADTYIEADITCQKVYMYQNGKLIISTDMVSGSKRGGHSTRCGAFYITGLYRNRVLRGPGYASPVSYWMPFHAGEGLHDATWRDTFGGDIYINNGSHGCLNLPLSNAAIIYENASKGYPVMVFTH